MIDEIKYSAWLLTRREPLMVLMVLTMLIVFIAFCGTF